MEDPLHVLAAPSHPDPYAWYARLRVGRPMFFDASLGCWVVSGPHLVDQALRHAGLRVRPPAQPVPKPLLGTPTGEVFAQLVRMNDGAFHAQHRPALAKAAAGLDDAAVARASEAAVDDLAARTAPEGLLSAVPVQAMARLLRVPEPALDATVAWVHDFARGIAAAADQAARERADAAVLGLMEQAEAEGLPRQHSVHRIALMQQSLDATAGLIGNGIRWLQLQREAGRDLAGVVAQVLRHDPPIHNTRRFAAEDVDLGGHPVAAGDALVLVLVAGEGGRGLGFGAGPHACPGERVAVQIAATALRSLQALDALRRFGPVRGYRPLPNARIPVFGDCDGLVGAPSGECGR